MKHPANKRRGGVNFSADSGDVKLQHVKYPEAKVGIMKVKSLEDSLRTCDMEAKESSTISDDKRVHSLSELQELLNRLPIDGEDGEIDLDAFTEEEETGGSEHSQSGVHFGDLKRRVFAVEAVEHPGLNSTGVAIGLTWKYNEEDAVDIDQYEATRKPRQSMFEMKMKPEERKKILLAQGMTTAEIAKIVRKIQIAKEKRRETLRLNEDSMKIEEDREQKRRRRQQMLGLQRTSAKDEDLLWDKAQQK